MQDDARLSVTIDPPDVQVELLDEHREAMLELILAWASLDGALAVMLAHMAGMTIVEGAADVSEFSTTKKLALMVSMLRRVPDGNAAARTLKRHKRVYERYSHLRNRVAHSHCAGHLRSDSQYLVFLPYEPFGDDMLAVELIPIGDMIHAARWGRALRGLALRAASLS